MAAPATSTITGNLYDSSGTAISGATVKINLTNTFVSTVGQYIIPTFEKSTTTSALGAFSLTVVAGPVYTLSIIFSDGVSNNRPIQYALASFASGSSFDFTSLITEQF